jgi:hypothetical protein
MSTRVHSPPAYSSSSILPVLGEPIPSSSVLAALNEDTLLFASSTGAAAGSDQDSSTKKPSSLPNFKVGNGCLFPFFARSRSGFQQQTYCGIAYPDAIMRLKRLLRNGVTKIHNRYSTARTAAAL